MSVYALNRTAITVQWGPVDCIHRNGDITGYSVRYGKVGSAEGERTVVEMVSGDFSGGMCTISGLSPATVYAVEVAAETSAGSGPYSEPVSIETPDSEYLHFLDCMEPLLFIHQVYILVCMGESFLIMDMW